MSRTSTDFIVIHCADTYPDMDVGAADIRRWHSDPKPKGRGWRDIGYHYVIRRDGTLEDGRDTDGDGDVLDEIGAHAYGFNGRSIGICLVGGKSRKTDRADANFTAAQWRALAEIVQYLHDLYPAAAVVGHRDLDDGKECPGFDVMAWAETLLQEAA